MRPRLCPGRGEAVGALYCVGGDGASWSFDRNLGPSDRSVRFEAVEIDDQLALPEKSYELERARGGFQARSRACLGQGLGLVAVVMALMRDGAARHA